MDIKQHVRRKHCLIYTDRLLFFSTANSWMKLQINFSFLYTVDNAEFILFALNLTIHTHKYSSSEQINTPPVLHCWAKLLLCWLVNSKSKGCTTKSGVWKPVGKQFHLFFHDCSTKQHAANIANISLDRYIPSCQVTTPQKCHYSSCRVKFDTWVLLSLQAKYYKLLP